MSSYAVTLGQLTSKITLNIDIATLVFGTIGSICNLFTLHSRQMPQSSTVFYLICAAVSQIITILFCVPLRLYASLGTNYLENRSIVFCKLRFYLIVILPALSPYYMCLASLDRCLSTSNNPKMRRWSQMKVEKALSAGTVILLSVVSIHILILYDIYQGLCQISPETIYKFIFSGYLIIFITFLPHILMFIFCLITLWNIRKSHRRLVPILQNNSTLNRRVLQRFEFKLFKVKLSFHKEIYIFFSSVKLDHCRPGYSEYISYSITSWFLQLHCHC